MPRRELVENTGVNSGPSKSSTNWNPNSLRRFLVEPIPFKKRLKDIQEAIKGYANELRDCWLLV